MYCMALTTICTWLMLSVSVRASFDPVSIFTTEYRIVPNGQTSSICKQQCGHDYKNFQGGAGVLIGGVENAKGTGCECQALQVGFTNVTSGKLFMVKAHSYVNHIPSMSLSDMGPNDIYITDIPIQMDIGAELTITFMAHSPWTTLMIHLFTVENGDTPLYLLIMKNAGQTEVGDVVGASTDMEYNNDFPFYDDALQMLTIRVQTATRFQFLHNSIAWMTRDSRLSPSLIRKMQLYVLANSAVDVTTVDFKAAPDFLNTLSSIPTV